MAQSSLSYGQNSWLVDEMYEKFLKDPSQIDKNWVEFFQKHQEEFVTKSTQKTSPDPTENIATATINSNPDDNLRSSSVEQPSTNNSEGIKYPAVVTASEAGNNKPTISSTFTRENATPPKGSYASSTHITHTVTTPESPTLEPSTQALRGPAAAIAKNMSASLEIPTATSVRTVPAKLMIENRLVINNYLARTRGGKVSFTHILGFAIVQAVKKFPSINNHFDEINDKPSIVTPAHINLGLAIDLPGKNNNRSLVVAAIKKTESMDFAQFHSAYEDIVRRARDGKLGADDFSGVTISLTNPGTLGTVHSVPRLMKGQGAIIGAGAMEYPAEYEGASEETIAKLGIGKLITLTSTYDHRIIQGAESGDFLRIIHELLISNEFYDSIFDSLYIPYPPVRWSRDVISGDVDKNTRVLEIINAYRVSGHLLAQTDPLGITDYVRLMPPDIDEGSFQLTLWDLDREFCVGGFQGKSRMKLRDILGALRDSYSRHIGVEYEYILEPEQRKWLQERLEAPHSKPTPSRQKYILNRLNAAEAFETFLQTKYVGQKRFSLEGAESVIPMMDAVLDQSATHKLEEVVIGMPHRGRLNVLANVVGKPYSKIFCEFEGNIDPRNAHGSGDVKYHLGAEGKYYQMFGDNEIKVSLTANPSHLEAVNPVVQGIVRAKTDQNGHPGSILPLVLHGDAAFAGQGVVAETLQMMNLTGYSAQGTIHIVVNNQIGFTTAPKDSRSSEYCTDVAKMIGAPVFHVNGDDPEACVWVAQLAVDFRQQFHKDVVIDMVCYRRRGHNESDDPSMTQPVMYDIIEKMRSVRKSYTEDLIGRGDITTKEAEDALRDYQGQLERVFNEVKEIEKYQPTPSSSVEGDQVIPAELKTSVSREAVTLIGDAFMNPPEGFTPHPRVLPVIKKRYEMSRKGNIDWAFAELLAFGSLVREGKRVRLSGEDSRRGTFSQRHSVLIDRKNGDEYYPLRNIPPLDSTHNGTFEAYDSLLSEYAVMGFEYGYTVANPNALVLWEGQFGDFAIAAQSIIDEFLSSGEAKWSQLSNLVLLLPHGQEGQGPDHSSGRIERYLQLCAEGSMTVSQPSTPASYFHLLRRHALDGVTRPLIVFTPKSMLRLKTAVSSVEDITEGKFRSVLEESDFLTNTADRSKVTRILLVAGKIYYELYEYKKNNKREDITIIRLEQFYPVPYRRLAKTLQLYPNAQDIVWVQEEPANQGAWPFLALALPELVSDNRIKGLRRVSRRAMSAPASGSAKAFAVEQQKLIEEAFA